MREALHVEWTKLRTVAGTAWLLAAVVLLTVALGVVASASVGCSGVGCGQDPAKISLTGIAFGQAVVAVLAVLAVGGEYGTGMIRVTFAAIPRRTTVLAAKSVVVGGLVLVAGVVAVLVSVLVGRLVLPGRGFTEANGHAVLSLADGPVLRAAVGSVLYLVLVGLMSIGVAAAVRDAATAIGVVLGLLYLFPIVAAVVSDPDWFKRLQRISPMTAGLTVQVTTGLDQVPIGPWAGLGVLGLWAAGALVVGGVLLRARDA
ncbi:MAG: ABC transporter permease subunit [Saccharothrix sp.]|nr:ABC transporter permease subunit [Saccharothrix sp.]